MEQIVQVALQALTQIFLLVATLAAGAIFAWVRKRTSSEQQSLIEKVVREGILYAQETYGDLTGQERFQKALEAITASMNERGMKVTEEQLLILIQSILKELKKEFGDAWSSTQISV